MSSQTSDTTPERPYKVVGKFMVERVVYLSDDELENWSNNDLTDEEIERMMWSEDRGSEQLRDLWDMDIVDE